MRTMRARFLVLVPSAHKPDKWGKHDFYKSALQHPEPAGRKTVNSAKNNSRAIERTPARKIRNEREDKLREISDT